MQTSGITLNSVSIFGLALALGSIVDASMVVIESISNHLHKGETLAQAVTEGVNEVNFRSSPPRSPTRPRSFPCSSSRATPAAFLFAMPMTNIFALLASNLVAVTVIPLLCYPLFKDHLPEVKEEKPSVSSTATRRS